jgi:branched-chain amino acid transport system ATP-binding protein
MVKHRRGSVRVDGAELIDLPTHRIARRHAALVPEGRRLFLNQSVRDNLLLGAIHLRGQPERIARLRESVLELFPRLHEYEHRPASALSGGEQQMVAIGRMLMGDPHVLLLDEPSLGLAPRAIDDVVGALVQLRAQGRSLLLVEQRTDVALRVCDRVYVMSGGEVVLEDRADAVDLEERALINAYLG